MRIIELIPQMGYGGAERLVVDLSNYFADRGHTVSIVLFHSPRSVGNPSFLNCLYPHVEVTVMEKHTGMDLKIHNRLRKFARDWKADLIHSHLDALPYTALCRLPVVHTIHNSPRIEAAGPLRKAIRHFMFRSGMATAVGCSSVSACEASAFYGVTCEPIPNGRRGTSPAPPARRVIRRENIVCAGWGTLLVNIATTSPLKGQIRLAEAVSILNRRLPYGRRILMVIVGQTRPGYIADIRRAGEGSVMIVGPSDHPEDWLEASDAMVISSLEEGLPMTLIEAMWAGKICVSTPAGGVRDVITDGYNGILARGFDISSILQALKRLLKMTTDEKLRMSEAALATSLQFSIERCGARYESLFRSISGKT